jgi:hypothetical protein
MDKGAIVSANTLKEKLLSGETKRRSPDMRATAPTPTRQATQGRVTVPTTPGVLLQDGPTGQ